jgi:hypothetical protein
MGDLRIGDAGSLIIEQTPIEPSPPHRARGDHLDKEAYLRLQ